ncbi:MAG: hypothetical protein JWP64_747 [Pseudonocardia sp.]|jgi:hypothetical protein|nr:hypothetical protein [Pseudonocardia sp.]
MPTFDLNKRIVQEAEAQGFVFALSMINHGWRAVAEPPSAWPAGACTRPACAPRPTWCHLRWCSP